jgi:acetoacetyl-CoA reductase
VARVVDELGPPTVLVNNAGVLRDNLLFKMSDADWDTVMNVHLRGAFLVSRACQKHMVDAGFGRIVNLSSSSALGNRGQVNYAAAKSGIHGFTKALAQEGAAKNITVNAIAPGYIDTDMVRAVPPQVLEKIVAKIPVGRLGRAEEIARGVLFLVADDAGFITGSTLSINGGQHMY